MQTNYMSLRRKTTTAVSAKLKMLYTILKYILIMISFSVLSFASVSGGAYGNFAFGLYFALICLPQLNGLTTSLMYIFGVMLANLSLTSLYIVAPVVLFGVIVWLLNIKLKRRLHKLIVLLISLVSNVGFIYVNATSVNSTISTIVSIALGLMFCFSCLQFFTSVVSKGFSIKLNLDEVITGSVVLIVFSMGLTAINPFGIEFVKIFAVISILLATYMFPGFTGLFVASLIGLGSAFYTLNVGYFASFVSFSLISTAFKSNNKIFSCLGIILTEIVFGLYFNVYPVFSVYSVISVVVAEVLFLVLPQKLTIMVSDKLGGLKEKVALRNIINHSKEGICRRMNEIAHVFSEMDASFRAMVKGVLPLEDAKKMLTAEVIDKISKNSPEITKALRLDEKTTYEVFSDLINIGFERGKITLLDIPPYITSKVGKVNYLINTINQLLTSYKHYSTMVTNMDTSRILIADQLSGVSNILKSLAEEVNLNITFDQSKENRIIEELSFKSIYCQEAIVYEQNARTIHTTLVIKNTDVNEKTIEKVVSKITASRMKIISVVPSTVPGCVLVTLKTQPNYDIVFGSASAGKHGQFENGDSHSLIKIGDGKFMVALCDGMGSGKQANLTSSLSISLIENFYKAGFDNEIILNSVNKLLVQNSEDNFSALDICVIDANKGICDFIKMASPQGFIKHKGSTELVETNGLPIGILEEMQPHITKKVINDFDIIVLVSDGITQAFEKAGEDLFYFINNQTTQNPQTLADEILERAVDINDGVVDDDMTVVAVRVYPVE